MTLGRLGKNKKNEPSGEGPDVAKVGAWLYRGKILGADETHTGVFHYTGRDGVKRMSVNFEKK